MTISKADRIAENLFRQPRMYDSPPKLATQPIIPLSQFGLLNSYAFVNEPNQWGGAVAKPNMYVCRGGFSKAYAGTIDQWEKTKVERYSSIEYPPTRYVTIDDIRMMAYVGIEYARAKLYGWRYRYGELGEDGSVYPRGYIVRTTSGQRFVHRIHEGYTTAPYGEGKWDDRQGSYHAWAPMQRAAGFAESTSGDFVLPSDYSVPDEPTSDLVLLGEIEGDDDVISIAPFRTGKSFGLLGSKRPYKVEQDDILENLPSCRVRSGGFSIFITNSTQVSATNITTKGVVAFQQVVHQVYKLYNSYEDYLTKQNYTIWWENEEDFWTRWYEIFCMRDNAACLVPLKKGVVYRVYAKFDEAEIYKLQPIEGDEEGRLEGDIPLCVYSRKPVRTTAPMLYPYRT